MTERPIISAKSVRDRFWSMVRRASPDQCWEWAGSTNDKGYGRFHSCGVSEMAHRTSVRLDGRDIPAGMEIDHICRNRGCVNPRHLRVVTHRENLLAWGTRAAVAAARTHCPNGHPLGGGNLAIRRGKRLCRECDRERNAAFYTPKSNRRRRRHLTKEEVSRIRNRIASGASHSVIAAELNISVSTVSNVRNGRNDYGR